MIKRYNQFVKGKVNEDYEFETEAPVRTIPSLGKPAPSSPEVAPGTIEKPSTIPSKPSPFRRDKPSTEPGTKAELGGEEEEVGYDKYTTALKSLADAAGVDFNEADKMVVINGKEVTFPAEDEKYHIKGIKKGFTSVEDVLANVGGQSNEEPISSIKDEEALEETEDDLDKIDLEDEMGTFESKSYKNTRLKKFRKWNI